MTKVGVVVNTLTDNGEKGFADGTGADTRFNGSHRVVFSANGDLILSDCLNHCLRVVTPEVTVLTLVDNG